MYVSLPPSFSNENATSLVRWRLTPHPPLTWSPFPSRGRHPLRLACRLGRCALIVEVSTGQPHPVHKEGFVCYLPSVICHLISVLSSKILEKSKKHTICKFSAKKGEKSYYVNFVTNENFPHFPHTFPQFFEKMT